MTTLRWRDHDLPLVLDDEGCVFVGPVAGRWLRLDLDRWRDRNGDDVLTETAVAINEALDEMGLLP